LDIVLRQDRDRVDGDRLETREQVRDKFETGKIQVAGKLEIGFRQVEDISETRRRQV
jgi:hypothetical protein